MTNDKFKFRLEKRMMNVAFLCVSPSFITSCFFSYVFFPFYLFRFLPRLTFSFSFLNRIIGIKWSDSFSHTSIKSCNIVMYLSKEVGKIEEGKMEWKEIWNARVMCVYHHLHLTGFDMRRRVQNSTVYQNRAYAHFNSSFLSPGFRFKWAQYEK